MKRFVLLLCLFTAGCGNPPACDVSTLEPGANEEEVEAVCGTPSEKYDTRRFGKSSYDRPSDPLLTMWSYRRGWPNIRSYAYLHFADGKLRSWFLNGTGG